jgi:hypothetical protein
VQRVIAQARGSTVIQPKLKVGPVADRYEQEADRMAQAVIRMPAPVQRQDELEEDELRLKPLVQPVGEGGFEPDTDFERRLNHSRGGGQPLSEALRADFESKFGADFSGVKVHTDAQSDQLNRSIQAKAFTTGQDVFFRQGAYQPESRGGQALIAHELTHVVQQNGGVVQRKNLQPQPQPQHPGPKAPKAREGGRAQDWHGIREGEEEAEEPRRTTPGMPDRLKTGLENQSGNSIEEVREHYNSAKPAQLQAHAYTQVTDIHVASGQEKHSQQLPQHPAEENPEATKVVAPTTRPRVAGTIQRKLGNRGNEGDWVWWDGAMSGYDPKGKITRIRKSRKPVPSRKYGNVVFEVIAYYVRMSDPRLGEDEKVDPQDPDWHFTSRAERQREEQQAEEQQAEEKEEIGYRDPLLSRGSRMQKLKGIGAAGGVLAGFAGGYAKKIEYLEGNIDKAVDTLNTVASWANRAGYAFPPIKVVTEPASSAIGAVNVLRQTGRMVQLLKDDQGRPLTFTQLDEARDQLARIPQQGLRSDEENMIEKAQDAILALRLWLERKTEEAEGKES